MANQSLHKIPKFSTSNKSFMLGNRHVPVLFVIPIVVSFCGHLVEIYAVIHGGIDLVFGMKNMVETEGVISTRDSTFKFISRSIPISTIDKPCIQHKSKVYINFRPPFFEDISGMPIAKLWGPDDEISTLKIRLKNNHGIVEFVNNISEEVTFLPKTVIGFLDLRSLGHFKVNYEYLVRRMGEHFKFFHYYKDTSDGTSEPILIGCMRSVMMSDKILTLPKTNILGRNQMILGDIRLMQRF